MTQQTETADFCTLAIDQLRESPTNPRRTFNEAKLQELAQSIRSQGILVPLIVRKTAPETFEVVAGARRFRAQTGPIGKNTTLSFVGSELIQS